MAWVVLLLGTTILKGLGWVLRTRRVRVWVFFRMACLAIVSFFCWPEPPSGREDFRVLKYGLPGCSHSHVVLLARTTILKGLREVLGLGA